MFRLPTLAARIHSFGILGRMATSDCRGILQHFSKHGLHDKAVVNGLWVTAKSNKTFDVFNPATDEVVASVPDMDESDPEKVSQATHAAFKLWKDTAGKERVQLLRSWDNLVIAKQKELVQVLTLENGKPIKEALGEITYSADYLEICAEEAKGIHGDILQSPVKSKQMFLVREPVGVAGMRTPWNFPTAMIARKAAVVRAIGSKFRNNGQPSNSLFKKSHDVGGALSMRPMETFPFVNPGASNMLGGVRPVTYYSMQKGKRKTVKTVLRRFFRLYWGAWIRPRAGRHRKVWRKNGAMKNRALQHVFCNSTQSHMLDKMVCKFWREKKYYVDDPYESYHVRDNFHITRKWP